MNSKKVKPVKQRLYYRLKDGKLAEINHPDDIPEGERVDVTIRYESDKPGSYMVRHLINVEANQDEFDQNLFYLSWTDESREIVSEIPDDIHKRMTEEVLEEYRDIWEAFATHDREEE